MSIREDLTHRDDVPAFGYQPRIVVKFRDGLELPYDVDVDADDGARASRAVGEQLEERKLAPWSQLRERYPDIALEPLFTTVDPQTLDELVRTARQRDETYDPPDFRGYFAIDVPWEADPEEVVKILNGWRAVETAYVEPMASDPSIDASDDPRSGAQGYLDPAPTGIDAEFVWPRIAPDGTALGFPGGDGAGQYVIDLEQGWTLNHEDLASVGATLLGGTLINSSRAHGTSVLGEMVSADNSVGCVGIAPEANADVISWNGLGVANAIVAAIPNLSFAEVLLLEVQRNFLPVELWDADFEAIRLATALGITVVEAAGNGSANLNTATSPSGDRVLDRTHADFRDSGAIIVGAAVSTVLASGMHARDVNSNFGNRVDCYAWGDSVVTPTSDASGATNLYRNNFQNTSAAAPTIAGAALLVQGIADADPSLSRFAPQQLRDILSDPANGTGSPDPIGVMPNMRAIVEGSVLNLAPDIYVRDNIADDGDVHTGSISASPDVILRPFPVADPTASFGEGSGTENDSMLGFEVEDGQDNYLYTRVRNRGGTAATNVEIQLFWSEVATLVTPDMWTPVGTTTIPTVPTGDQLTVSDAIVWSTADIPSAGHYCLVAVIGTGDDPAPNPATFTTFDQFRQFVRANNNATWRNFNVVSNLPDPDADPEGFVSLPFLVPGAFDRMRPMGLEVRARLPAGARVFLEAPASLDRQFDERRYALEKAVEWEDDDDNVVRVPVPAAGVHRIDEMALPAKEAARFRLLVDLPEKRRENEYELAVRQLHEEEEVGRVTWRLLSPAKLAERRKRIEREAAGDAGHGLVIRAIHADAAGVPESEHLNDEYIVLGNEGDEALDLGGAVVDFDDGQRYELPDGTVLEPGATLTVRTGVGEDTEDERYAGFRAPVLNNEGDTVRVRNAAGDVIAIKAYGLAA